MTTDITTLIAKLEAATRPSQELDLEIWKFLNPEAIEIGSICSSGDKQFVAHHTRYSKDRYEKALLVCTGHIREANYKEHRELLPFTRSIDAALTLVPKGSRWSVIKQMDDRFLSVVTDRLGWQAMGVAQIASMALCIASLRARRSGEAQP